MALAPESQFRQTLASVIDPPTKERITITRYPSTYARDFARGPAANLLGIPYEDQARGPAGNYIRAYADAHGMTQSEAMLALADAYLDHYNVERPHYLGKIRDAYTQHSEHYPTFEAARDAIVAEFED